MENKTAEMVVKDLLLADNRKKNENCMTDRKNVSRKPRTVANVCNVNDISLSQKSAPHTLQMTGLQHLGLCTAACIPEAGERCGSTEAALDQVLDWPAADRY